MSCQTTNRMCNKDLKVMIHNSEKGIYTNWDDVSHLFSHMKFTTFDYFLEIITPVKYTVFSKPESKAFMITRIQNMSVLELAKDKRCPDAVMVDLNNSYMGRCLKDIISCLLAPEEESASFGRGTFHQYRFKFVQVIKELFEACSETVMCIAKNDDLPPNYGLYDRYSFENFFGLKWENIS